MTILDQMGGRKFSLSVMGVWQVVVLGTAGVYIAGNVSQKVFVKPTTTAEVP